MRTAKIWGLAATALITLALVWNARMNATDANKSSDKGIAAELVRVKIADSSTESHAPPAVAPTSNGQAKVRAIIPGPEMQKIAALRQAGIKADASQVPLLLEALKKPQPEYQYAAIHALSQIGATESLPVFDSLLASRGTDADLRNFLQVARARLVAESSAKGIADANKRAQFKMQTLLAEANVSVAQLNDAPARKEQLRTDNEAAKPVTLYVLRELADMIYRKHDAALLNYAQLQGVQFGFRPDLPFTSLNAARRAQVDGIRFLVDTPAALKAGLGPLTNQERVNWLIEKLSTAWVMDEDTYYAIQLAIDEGVPASHAAAIKLKEIASSRKQYGYGAISALMRVIAGVGDKEEMPVIASFLADDDKYVVQDARNAYDTLGKGIPIIYGLKY